MNAALALQGTELCASLGGCQVLHAVQVGFAAGRWTSVVGPNGAGKSTLLKVLAGLLPGSGQVHLLGQPLQQLPARQRARQLAWLGQNETVADDLSVHDVVMLGRWAGRRPKIWPQWNAPCAPPRPGTGANAPWASSPAVSANGCCWRARCRWKPRCC